MSWKRSLSLISGVHDELTVGFEDFVEPVYEVIEALERLEIPLCKTTSLGDLTV